MMTMAKLSLVLNILVLVPVCAGLLTDADWATASYGESTPARSILLSVYLSIGLASALLLFRPEPLAVATLLALQVVYKLSTPLTVGSLANPVVVSNIGIAAFHLVTLVVIIRNTRPFS